MPQSTQTEHSPSLLCLHASCLSVQSWLWRLVFFTGSPSFQSAAVQGVNDLGEMSHEGCCALSSGSKVVQVLQRRETAAVGGLHCLQNYAHVQYEVFPQFHST